MAVYRRIVNAGKAHIRANPRGRTRIVKRADISKPFWRKQFHAPKLYGEVTNIILKPGFGIEDACTAVPREFPPA